MENILSAAELKRRGMASIESSLQNGPVHLYKRNRRVAVVLSEAEYQRLTAVAGRSVPGKTALEWLLDHPSKSKRTRDDIDQQLRDNRNW